MHTLMFRNLLVAAMSMSAALACERQPDVQEMPTPAIGAQDSSFSTNAALPPAADPAWQTGVAVSKIGGSVAESSASLAMCKSNPSLGIVPMAWKNQAQLAKPFFLEAGVYTVDKLVVYHLPAVAGVGFATVTHVHVTLTDAWTAGAPPTGSVIRLWGCGENGCGYTLEVGKTYGCLLTKVQKDATDYVDAPGTQWLTLIGQGLFWQKPDGSWTNGNIGRDTNVQLSTLKTQVGQAITDVKATGTCTADLAPDPVPSQASTVPVGTDAASGTTQPAICDNCPDAESSSAATSGGSAKQPDSSATTDAGPSK